MGPGLAVVGTPGSPSDVARTEILLHRPLGDCVRFIVRLRSVSTYWLGNHSLLNELIRIGHRNAVLPLYP